MRNPIIPTLPALLASLLGCALAPHTVHASPLALATVAQGQLAGLSSQGVSRFLGVPYALPPTGERRWRPPQPASAWSGTRDATRFGSSCPQAADMFGPASDNEDCLTLNVYAPQSPSAQPRPVLVYVHGGGFWSGSGTYYDGSVLARRADAVVVTINYRLGVFGFLSTPSLVAEQKAVNFGLQDQHAALAWVQRNIAAFGGDANRVTLAGQSAGGGSVCLAMVSPRAAGLFQRAIMHSPACTMASAPLSKANARGQAIAAKAGCPEGAQQLACLRAKPVAELLAAAAITTPTQALADSFWPATIDGEVLPGAVLSTLMQGRFHKVPTVIGTTLDEGRGIIGWGFHGIFGRDVTQAEYEGAMAAFGGDLAGSLVTSVYPASRYGSVGLALSQALTDVALACPTRNVAQALAAGGAPTYHFEFADARTPQYFNDPLMPQGWGAYHMGELRYVFQQPVSGLSYPGLDPAQQALSDQMVGHWRRFLATGNPNGAGLPDVGRPELPTWPRSDSSGLKVMRWQPQGSEVIGDAAFQKAHQCVLWSSYYGLAGLMGLY